MARKPALSAEKLKEIGADKLAQLVLDEAGRNTGFRRQVKAALAAKSGPEAVGKLIDRRLAGLEKASSFIEWDKARAFRDDLRSLVHTTVTELGTIAPTLAVDRLLRFIVTHEQVFERVDDSSGSIQDVYYQAIAATGDLTQFLNEEDADLLPERIMALLGEASHGYLADLTEAVAPHLPPHTLEGWDAELAARVERRKAEDLKNKSDHWVYSMGSQWSEMRQTIAAARGDLDLLIQLEAQKRSHMQDTMGLAARLLEAGRADEALDWVRRPGNGASGDPNGLNTPNRVSLEARILEALEDKPAAQALRWRCFETVLPAELLRQYLKNLPDFDDIDALERALSVALKHNNHDAALQFFLDWPRPDLAARLIVAHHHYWDGGAYYSLPKIAGFLEHEYPLAATILYRALLDNILAGARSRAYSHGAKYLKQLTLLADDASADPAKPRDLPDHPTYFAGLKKKHPRKSGFWGQVDSAK